MHFQCRGKNQKARADEFLVLVMVAQHMTDVLAQEAFDALAKFLDAVNVPLCHAPGAVRRVGRARLEFLDFFLYPVIPQNVRRQVANPRKRPHWLDGYGFVERQLIESRHAHELRHAIDFGRTGTAFPGLAVPSAGEIVGLRGLNVENGVEHDHALGNFRRVIRKVSAVRIAAPDFENRRFHFISSITCFKCSGISGIGSRRVRIEPSASLWRMIFTLPSAASLLGKSSRKCPPRLSFRSMAARVMASETVSRCFKSIAVCQPGLYSRWP